MGKTIIAALLIACCLAGCMSNEEMIYKAFSKPFSISFNSMVGGKNISEGELRQMMTSGERSTVEGQNVKVTYTEDQERAARDVLGLVELFQEVMHVDLGIKPKGKLTLHLVETDGPITYKGKFTWPEVELPVTVRAGEDVMAAPHRVLNPATLMSLVLFELAAGQKPFVSSDLDMSVTVKADLFHYKRKYRYEPDTRYFIQAAMMLVGHKYQQRLAGRGTIPISLTKTGPYSALLDVREALLDWSGPDAGSGVSGKKLSEASLGLALAVEDAYGSRAFARWLSAARREAQQEWTKYPLVRGKHLERGFKRAFDLPLREFIAKLDLNVPDATFEQRGDPPVDFARGLLYVADVRPGSAAWLGGLRPGQRVMSVRGMPCYEVVTLERLYHAMVKGHPKRIVPLTIERVASGGASTSITIEIRH